MGSRWYLRIRFCLAKSYFFGLKQLNIIKKHKKMHFFQKKGCKRYICMVIYTSILKCLNSSAVEQSAVNRSVGGSNPSSSASGRLEKRLTHMPFTHAFTGSNPVPVTINGGLAQLGEHLPYKQRVSGSSPLTSTIFLPT